MTPVRPVESGRVRIYTCGMTVYVKPHLGNLRPYVFADTLRRMLPGHVASRGDRAPHTGGVDHRQIHHVNEIAQSEAYLGEDRPWVPVWMHNEFVTLGTTKIAKSSGRAPTLDDLVASGHHPLAYRLFPLNAHYRRQVELTESGCITLHPRCVACSVAVVISPGAGM